MRSALLVAVLLVAGSEGVPVDADLAADEQNTFPANFLFGAATASYQVEGGWNASGKGEGMWDRFTHEHPEAIEDGSNGDVACDSFHKYKEDVQLLKNLGMNFYRFSISWPRVLPTGAIDNINEEGIQYYDNLINEIIAQGMIPMVTMFHWDLPQAMMEIGGWPSEFIIDFFVDYCELLFQRFGSKVKHWMILNEPLSVCAEGWGQGTKAPAYKDNGRADYFCAHNILKAHGRVYRLYEKKFKSDQKGKVGIALNSDYYFPANESNPDDVAAANRVQHMNLGWYANPIFGKDGDYPAVMKEYVKIASDRQKLKRSRLPEFTAEEVAMIKGAADFFGINSYTSRAVNYVPSQEGSPRSKYDDWQAGTFFKPEWEPSIADWLVVAPEGFRRLLNFIKDNYGDPDIIVTEQGYPDYTGLKDVGRTTYYQKYLLELLKAIHIDNVKVFGYTAWSLMDNFEWFNGYKNRFGIHFVDFNDPNRPRTPKMSAMFFKTVIATRTVPDPSSIDFPDDPVDPPASSSPASSTPASSSPTSSSPVSGSPVLRAGCTALLAAIAVVFLV